MSEQEIHLAKLSSTSWNMLKTLTMSAFIINKDRKFTGIKKEGTEKESRLEQKYSYFVCSACNIY